MNDNSTHSDEMRHPADPPESSPPRDPCDASCKKPPQDASQNFDQPLQQTEKKELTSLQVTTPHTPINASPPIPGPWPPKLALFRQLPPRPSILSWGNRIPPMQSPSEQPRFTGVRPTSQPQPQLSRPFQFQQPPLHRQPAAVPHQLSLGADHAMAGHHDGHRVGAIGGTHGAHRPRGSEGRRNLQVAARFT